MSLNSHPTQARRQPKIDYNVSPANDEPLIATPAAFKMLADFRRLKDQRRRLAAAYAGGHMLLMFHRAPWLQSCSFVLHASSEYDDEGGYCRSVRFGNVTQLLRVPGVEPDPELCEEGIFSDEAAHDWIEAHFEYDAASISEVFRGDDALEDLEVTCDRNAVAGELARLSGQGAASGTLAFASLWPEEAHLVAGR